jgi:hypothetical protein
MSFKKIIPALKVRQWLSGWDKAEFLRRSFFSEGRSFGKFKCGVIFNLGCGC